jgi:hypothetical protein
MDRRAFVAATMYARSAELFVMRPTFELVRVR